jgi:hypothetical protein
VGALQGKDPLTRQQHRNQLGDGDLDIAGKNVASLGTGLGVREPDIAGKTMASRGTGSAARDTLPLLADIEGSTRTQTEALFQMSSPRQNSMNLNSLKGISWMMILAICQNTCQLKHRQRRC